MSSSTASSALPKSSKRYSSPSPTTTFPFKSTRNAGPTSPSWGQVILAMVKLYPTIFELCRGAAPLPPTSSLSASCGQCSKSRRLLPAGAGQAQPWTADQQLPVDFCNDQPGRTSPLIPPIFTSSSS